MTAATPPLSGYGRPRQREVDVVLYAFPFSVAPGRGSGVERYAFELASNLKRFGRPAAVVAKPEGGRATRFLASFTTTPLRTLSLRPKVFHAVSPYSARVLFALRRRPVITTVHDVIFRDWLPESPDFFERRRRRYNELAIRQSDALIVPFEYTKRRIREAYGIPSDRIIIVNYGIDLHRFYHASEELAEPAKRTFDLVFLGGHNALARGGRTVLATCDRLLKLREGIRIAISATGRHGVILRNEARARGIEDRVRWIGFVPEEDLPRLLASSSVFLYPTQMGFSFLHMQAMAAGSAIVTSDAYDIPEFVRDSAITHDRDDVEGYVESTLRLLADPGERDKLVSQARSRILGFTPATMTAQTIAAYASIEA